MAGDILSIFLTFAQISALIFYKLYSYKEKSVYCICESQLKFCCHWRICRFFHMGFIFRVFYFPFICTSGGWLGGEGGGGGVTVILFPHDE